MLDRREGGARWWGEDIGEALWASDGSGAVIVDAEESAQANVFPLTGPLLFLKSDGSPELTLAGNGHMLRWGK